jgi:hypothetical protein
MNLLREQLILSQHQFNSSFLLNKYHNDTICLASMHEFHDDQQLLNDNLTHHKLDFATSHNMGYVEIKSEKYHKLYPKLPLSWLKISALYDIIKNDSITLKYDWYMYVDGDVFFTNSSCDFQNLLSINHNFILSSDFNSGVFLIRNTEWSLRFLEAWFNRWSSITDELGQEDNAFEFLILEQKIWNRHIYVIPQNEAHKIVSYPQITDTQLAWHPGHCILHTAGFWHDRFDLLVNCLKSENHCISALNTVYTAHNGTAYLPML